MEHTLDLCVDCYGMAGEGKILPSLSLFWLISSSDQEPHFTRGGAGSCGGCDTTLGGDRYTCEAWEVVRP
jgi:hypothetical protein